MDDDIIILKTADGEEIQFTEIAGIAYKGNYYLILQPVELFDGMDDDEALVFRMIPGENGESTLQVETDEDIVDHVFAEYNKLLDDATADASEEE